MILVRAEARRAQNRDKWHYHQQDWYTLGSVMVITSAIVPLVLYPKMYVAIKRIIINISGAKWATTHEMRNKIGTTADV